ncbi:MAG TPA: hypothetical protein VF103_17175 [Polyangiaceae bacterium]
MVVHRRTFLALLGAGSAVLAGANPAAASVARAIAVGELVKRSRSVVLGTPLAAYSEWATVGDARRIVTITRVRVDELVARDKPDASEVMVRTLGGRVGKLGQIVHGEAELRTDQTAMLFLHDADGGLTSVTAMAQGHYPLLVDARGKTLAKSPGLAKLLAAPDAAVERLAGLDVASAARLVREADKP